MSEVYLDNAATTWLDPRALEVMERVRKEHLGNSSAFHKLGVRAAVEVEKARIVIAEAIGASAEEIVFTSGGTESNNLALQGFCFANRKKGNHLVVSAIEHSSVYEVTLWLESQGFRVSYLPVDEKGFCNASELNKLLTKETILVSIIHGNNEIGTIQNLKDLGTTCFEKGVAFHTDACQSFTKTKINVRDANLAMVSLSAHKIHGPLGVGALFVRRGTEVSPLFHGGGQEKGLRPGTINLEGIVGFSAAVQSLTEHDIKTMTQLRDYIVEKLLSHFPKSKINGASGEHRLCNNVNISFPGTSSKKLLHDLDKKGISVSRGSSCASGATTPSRVLTSIGNTAEAADSSIRISICKWTTRSDADRLISVLKELL